MSPIYRAIPGDCSEQNECLFFLYSWNTKFLGANLPVSSGALADVDLFERIDESLRQILDSHQPEPLNEYVAAKITDIQVSFRDTHS